MTRILCITAYCTNCYLSGWEASLSNSPVVLMLTSIKQFVDLKIPDIGIFQANSSINGLTDLYGFIERLATYANE